jgi:NADH-quinone oxidoreductase subunit C
MNAFLDQLQAELLRLIAPEAPVQPVAAVSPPPVVVEGAAPVAPVAAPVLPCQVIDFKAKGYHLDAKLAPNQLGAAAELMDKHGFAIDAITGVDWMAAGEMELIYDFFHMAQPLQVVLRTRVPRANPEVPTISKVFPGANWHERETSEFFGIRFLGHPNLVPLLLPEDATYHPLRKDFAGVS